MNNVVPLEYDDPIPYLITELGAQLLEERPRTEMGDNPQTEKN